MSKTIAFDVYGTLINPHGVVRELEGLLGQRAGAFSALWRQKQLEYSFRRGLMDAYSGFAVCTRQALDFTCLELAIKLSEADKEALMAAYTRLPAYDDTVPALSALKQQDIACWAFSNGEPDDLESLFAHADLHGAVKGIISVDAVKSFKPDPRVYEHFLRESAADAADTWLVSSNPFDIIGARAAGWEAVWIQRDPTIQFDCWEWQPSTTLSSLSELSAYFSTLE